MMFLAADNQILTSMIAPALFMTATGSLIISTNNRLARVVDRMRVLIDLSDKITQPDSKLDFPELRLETFRKSMAHLQFRNKRIRSAMAVLYMAFTMFVCASLFIGIDLFFAHRLANVPTILAIAGVCSLLWGCINLFLESRTATNTVLMEIEFLKRLQEERERTRPPNVRSEPNV